MCCDHNWKEESSALYKYCVKCNKVEYYDFRNDKYSEFEGNY